jgi:hypothetical protein
MIYDKNLARQIYAPSVSTIQKNLPDIGSSLDTACCELSNDCTLDRLDRLAAQLNSAQTNLIHLRKAMISERVESHGTG